MQLKNQASICAPLAAATCSLLGTAPQVAVAADEDDKWQSEAALLYYDEDDDRVEDVSLNFTTSKLFSDDRQLTIGFQFDSLTGATPNGAPRNSVAQTFTQPSGNGTFNVLPGELPLDSTFKDTRIALQASWSQPVTDTSDFSFGFSVSDEYDYTHLGANAGYSWDLNQNNTTINTGLAFAFDEMDPEGGAPIPGSAMLGVNDDSNKRGDDDKTVLDFLVGVTQIINRESLFQANYSLSYSDGYLNDPYKLVSVVDSMDGTPTLGPPNTSGLYLYESRPDDRLKQSLYFQYKSFVFNRDTFDISYRFMSDDWDIDSSTIDFRYRWNINHRWYLEPHIRWYTQSEADFFATHLVDTQMVPSEFSADYRLGEFDATTVGAKVSRLMGNGSRISVRLEYYSQDGDDSTGLAASTPGALSTFELFPDMDAIIAQVSYEFSF